VEERDYFNESEQKYKASLNCPHCRQMAEYELRWAVRKKKDALPPRADERDRAKFAKFRSYMVRKDDVMNCSNPRCRKRFEISGIQSVVLM
jgi:sarcosine oxidase delta subunit